MALKRLKRIRNKVWRKCEQCFKKFNCSHIGYLVDHNFKYWFGTPVIIGTWTYPKDRHEELGEQIARSVLVGHLRLMALNVKRVILWSEGQLVSSLSLSLSSWRCAQTAKIEIFAIFQHQQQTLRYFTICLTMFLFRK